MTCQPSSETDKVSNNFTELIQCGRQLHESGNFDEAIKIFLQVVQIAPDNFDVYFSLAESYRISNRRHEELETMQKALSVSKTNDERAKALNNLSDPTAYYGYIEEAIGYLREAVSLFPDSAFYWMNLAGFLIREKNAIEGIELLERVKKLLEEDNHGYFMWLGRARMILGQYDAAVRAYERAVELKPEVSYLWRDLVMAYVDAGQYEKARQVCQTKLHQGLAYHLILARIACRIGDFLEARILTKKALEAMSDPSAFEDVKWHYCNRKSHEELIEYVKSISDAIPDCLWTHWILARLYSVLNDESSTTSEIKKALDIDPAITVSIKNDVYLLSN